MNNTEEKLSESAKQQLQADSATTTLVTAIVFNGALTLGLLVVFCFVRRWNRKVYEPKTYLVSESKRSPRPPTSLLGWLNVLQTTDDDIIAHSGLDAYMFLRFFRQFAKLFTFFTILGCGILLPINAINQGTLNGIDKWTIGNVVDKQRLWAHVGLAYIFVAATVYLLYKEHKEFIRLRQEYFTRPQNRKSAKATTVLVMGIPYELYDEEALKNLFSIFGKVKKIWLNSDPKHLPKLNHEREQLVNKFEGAATNLIINYAKHIKKNGSDLEKNGQVPKNFRLQHRDSPIPLMGRKVDSLEAYRLGIHKLNQIISKDQQDLNKRKPMRSAFIQFTTQTSAQLASTVTIPHTIEVAPNDVIWENLNRKLLERMIRKTISFATVSALILLWAIPVTFVATISKLDNLKEKIGFVKTIVDALPKVIVGIIQGVLPAIALAVLVMVLPIFLRFLSKFEGIVSYSHVAISVMNKYFFFLVVNVLLVTTFANGIFSAIAELTRTPSKALDILAENLPLAATFFITYVLLTFSKAALELCQVGPLIVNYVLKLFVAKTPRQIWILEKKMSAMDWGTAFPPHTLIACIGVIYSTVAPLILPFVAFHFILYYIAYMYNFLYVFDQPGDTGGLPFKKAVYQIYTGLFIFELTMTGLMFLKKAFFQGVVSIVLLVLTIILMNATRSLFQHNPSVEFLPVDLAGVVDRKKRVLVGESESRESLIAEKDEPAAEQPLEFSSQPPAEDLDQDAFTHPAFLAKQPIIWLPQDQAGIAQAEVEACQKDEVLASTAGASLDPNTLKVIVDGRGFPEDRE